MENEVQQTDERKLITDINDAYGSLGVALSISLKRAIRVGELLTKAKESLSHGEWIPWVEKNLVFGNREARRYMRVYSNRSLVSDFGGTFKEAIALLSEPRDEPAEQEQPEPVLDLGYHNDPALEESVRSTEREAKQLKQQLSSAQMDIKEKEQELQSLRKLKADKEKIERALSELHELEKRKQELFADAESTKLVQQVLVRSREFFTSECMQIPALKLRQESIKIMRKDFEGLVDLVDNWLEAIRSRFL